MTSTRFNLSQSARITGKSRTTIQSHVKSGKLSYQTDGDGKWIEGSELHRVYGKECDFSRVESTSKNPPKGKNDNTSMAGGNTHHELKSLQTQLTKETDEREREREQLQQQIEDLRGSLRLALEGHNKATLLLEDRTGRVGDWEQTLQSLEKRIQNQEKRFDQEREKIKTAAKKRIENYQQALEDEKSKSFWQKLFA